MRFVRIFLVSVGFKTPAISLAMDVAGEREEEDERRGRGMPSGSGHTSKLLDLLLARTEVC